MFYTNVCSPVNPSWAHVLATLVTMTDEKQAGFIAGGPRRVRGEDEGFWAFLLGWITSLFKVDRRI
jgi:hypothetical protein